MNVCQPRINVSAKLASTEPEFPHLVHSAAHFGGHPSFCHLNSDAATCFNNIHLTQRILLTQES